MSEIAAIQNRIAERLTRYEGKDYLLQKFLNKDKYKSLIDTSSLYIASTDRLSDVEEGFLFLQNSIECIKYITDNYKDTCKFISIRGIHSPYERCRTLLKQVFDFNHPRYMLRNKNGCFVRPDHDKINGYIGLTYDDAMKIFTCDLHLLRSNTYITCFCSNTDITEYMKQSYGDISIITTKHCLLESLEKDIPCLDFKTFPVMYIEENDADSLQFYQNTIYDYNIFGVKRTCYAEEEEFRVQFSHKQPTSTAANHIRLKIDLNKLIKKIITTNQCAYDFVADLNNQNGLHFNLELQS